MFCPNCGNHIARQVNFCNQCGRQINAHTKKQETGKPKKIKKLITLHKGELPLNFKAVDGDIIKIWTRFVFLPQGRVNRLQHFLIKMFVFSLIFLVVFLIEDEGIFFTISMILSLWINLIITIKRLHDLDLSGWSILLFLVPLVNLILLIYIFFVAGNKYPNKYGEIRN